MGINKAYVVFLSVAAILMLVVCVQYVQLRAELTNRSKNITALQEELANLNEANTTKYNAVMDSVNLEEVREKAMDDLGMVYANENQVVEYDNPDGDYIKQYEQMPDEDELYDLAELFKVFGDSTRIRILFVLFESEVCVCDLAEALNMTQSAISHQLRILKQSKLVTSRRDGKQVFYSLADGHVRTIIAQGREHIEE